MELAQRESCRKTQRSLYGQVPTEMKVLHGNCRNLLSSGFLLASAAERGPPAGRIIRMKTKRNDKGGMMEWNVSGEVISV